MSKRHTSKSAHRARPQVLEVRVMSPRIAWYRFLKVAAGITKLACILAVLGGLGWAGWQGIQHAFYRNPDFRLKIIDLNPNPVINEAGLAEAIDIDLTASLFDIDVDKATSALLRNPAISSARVERHLPGTLVVRLDPRVPVAWVGPHAPQNGSVRAVGGMLVDRNGIMFPCSELQMEEAAKLPIIVIQSATEPTAVGKNADNPTLRHCLRLLAAATVADSEAAHWIESIRQANEWSIELITRDGTTATFALGDHERQMQNLRAAMDHSNRKGYVIQTINLLPKRNIPITLRGNDAAPRAIPISEALPSNPELDQRAKDMNILLNRN